MTNLTKDPVSRDERGCNRVHEKLGRMATRAAPTAALPSAASKDPDAASHHECCRIQPARRRRRRQEGSSRQGRFVADFAGGLVHRRRLTVEQRELYELEAFHTHGGS